MPITLIKTHRIINRYQSIIQGRASTTRKSLFDYELQCVHLTLLYGKGSAELKGVLTTRNLVVVGVLFESKT